MEENAKAPFWMPALIYGAIAGFVAILLSVIFYLMNLSAASWTQWVSLPVAIIVLIFCLLAYRKEYLGGFATYGQMFKMALMIGIISTVLGTIFSYLMFTVIDPDLLEKVRLAAEEKIIHNPRIPEGMQDDMIARVDKNMAIGRMMIMALVGGIILNTILGLIVAAFIKKEQTPVDAAV
jgi:hypothetical protein